ncbi:MAG: hypothetical protein JW861_05065 [Bacteroidales bacterium]|nr:hypothetical protein [Bacteroidales bacterium]
MKVLFNKRFLHHNIGSPYEGEYRFAGFQDIFEEADDNGEEYITRIHPQPYVDRFRESCMNRSIVAEVQLTPESYDAAVFAVGLSVRASKEDAFAMVRPPGHHARKDSTSGFCFFNNMAIAAQHLVDEGQKVFILDIDGHHGDGTQSVFYDNTEVFYASIHQLYSYPFSGFPTETGTGKGEGYTMNIPLMAGSGDKEFLKALDRILERANEFRPDIVGVSAGFDGYYKDKLLNLEYSLQAFHECGLKLRRSFSHVFAILEGGYHDEIRQCTESFINGVIQGSKPSRIKWDTDLSIG